MTTKIISEAELEVIFNNLSKLAELANTNAYDYYIQMLKTQRLSEQPDKESFYERHHIIPRFEKGKSSDDPDNLVKVTVKEHVIAHWLRYKVFSKPQDLCAYLFRVGDTINSIKIRNELVSQARERDRIGKRYFFDSDFQTEMGKRGGKKGGSTDSDAQFLARQRVGLQYGRITGIKNQNETLKEFLANWSIWAFSENAFSTSRVKNRGKELHVLISPKKSFVEVFHALKTFVPFSLEGKNPATMHKLVYNERKNMFGWRIERTLTCSEAVEGIQDFYQNTSEFLYFEEDLLVNEDLE